MLLFLREPRQGRKPDVRLHGGPRRRFSCIKHHGEIDIHAQEREPLQHLQHLAGSDNTADAHHPYPTTPPRPLTALKQRGNRVRAARSRPVVNRQHHPPLGHDRRRLFHAETGLRHRGRAKQQVDERQHRGRASRRASVARPAGRDWLIQPTTDVPQKPHGHFPCRRSPSRNRRLREPLDRRHEPSTKRGQRPRGAARAGRPVTPAVRAGPPTPRPDAARAGRARLPRRCAARRGS